MIAKGLDLPLVTLVGVVAADTGLFLPDFRAAERTFQLLTQVAGRAGRSELGGEVVVQTYEPEHYAIVAASNHDYESFYRQEMAFRREQGYPPNRRLARLVYYHGQRAKAEAEAGRLATELQAAIKRGELADTDLIGQRVAYIRRGTAYALNLIEGWATAARVDELELTAETVPQAVEMIRTLRRCLADEPRLYRRSITGDPYTGGGYWYEAGGRGLHNQWRSRCEASMLGGLQAITEASADAAQADRLWAELGAEGGSDDLDLTVRLFRGEFDGLPNLLPNPSFENETGEAPVGPDWSSEGVPAGWGSWKIDNAKGKLYLDGSRAHSGKVAAVLQGGESMCYIATMPVETGRRYVTWVYAWPARIGGPHTAAIDLRWQDSQGHWCNEGANKRTLARRAQEWQKLATGATAPQGAARAVILLSAEGLEDADQVWFDDAAFCQVGE